jgi:hypothetical protein
MRDRAESILKVPTSLVILSMHMLPLDNETHFVMHFSNFPCLRLIFSGSE